jgi:hypothetical protein
MKFIFPALQQVIFAFSTGRNLVKSGSASQQQSSFADLSNCHP